MILVAFASAFMLYAQSSGISERIGTAIFPPTAPSFDELKANLGLSTAQVEQLMKIMQEKSEANQAAFRQIAEKQTELNNLLNSGSRDVNRIGQLMLDIHTLSKQPGPSNDQYRQGALAVLAAEQRSKLAPLDQAMKLNTPAWQAVTLNLIDSPDPGRPIILGSAAFTDRLCAVRNSQPGGNLRSNAYALMRPFGKTLTHSLQNARLRPDGYATWEEEDYCSPPLKEERAGALDEFFDELSVTPVRAGAGWEAIRELRKLFLEFAGKP